MSEEDKKFEALLNESGAKIVEVGLEIKKGSWLWYKKEYEEATALIRQIKVKLYCLENDLRDLQENHPKKEMIISRSLRWTEEAIAAAEKFLKENK